MNVNDLFPSKWLNANDLQGRRVQVTITRWGIEEMGDENKPVLFLAESPKGLPLNKTNATIISEMYGENIEGWVGRKIILGVQMVSGPQGKPVKAIRVELTAQAPAAGIAPGPVATAAGAGPGLPAPGVPAMDAAGQAFQQQAAQAAAVHNQQPPPVPQYDQFGNVTGWASPPQQAAPAQALPHHGQAPMQTQMPAAADPNVTQVPGAVPVEQALANAAAQHDQALAAEGEPQPDPAAHGMADTVDDIPF